VAESGRVPGAAHANSSNVQAMANAPARRVRTGSPALGGSCKAAPEYEWNPDDCAPGHYTNDSRVVALTPGTTIPTVRRMNAQKRVKADVFAFISATAMRGAPLFD
jgi:hypothetical protein